MKNDNSIFSIRWSVTASLKYILLILLSAGFLTTQAQTTISTTAAFLNNNGSGQVTFNFQNTNTYPVAITGLESISGTTGSVTAEIWFKTTAITAAPGAITVANGWALGATNTFNATANATTTITEPYFSGISIVIPAGSTYGMTVSLKTSSGGTASQRYFTWPTTAPSSFTAGGCILTAGSTGGWGGTAVPDAPTISLRGFIGKVIFAPLVACVGTPATPTVTGPTIVCASNPFSLTQTGGTFATGITYDWQKFNTVTSLWESTGTVSFDFTSPGIPSAAQYRVKTTCSGSASSTSAAFSVPVSPGLPGGTYTINSAVPTGGTNYASFAAAIDAMSCGVAGPVVFNVNPTSGPYVETITVPSIINASATNTIRFNGNGRTVQFNNTVTNRQLLTLDGARYVTFDSLIFKSLNTTYGWGALITNESYADSIKRCTFDLTSVTGTSSVNSNGITFSGSNTSPTSSSATYNGRKIYIGNNDILGTTGSGGPYYGLTLYSSDSNTVRRNTIKNFYYYGLYFFNAENNIVDGNDINRSTKTSVTIMYGIYINGASAGNQIISNRIHSPKASTASGGSSQYGIYCFGDASPYNKMLIGNNAIYNLNMPGTIYGAYISSGENIDFYHNSIILDQTTGSSATNYGMYFLGTNPNLQIKNNLVYLTAGGTGTKYGFYYGGATSYADAQRNMVYVNTTTTGTAYYGYNGSNYTNLAAFQAAFPTLEMGSVSLDPAFAAPATSNFINTNSLITPNGLNLTSILPVDIIGEPRPVPPTPGAFQTQLPPCLGTPLTPTLDGPPVVCESYPFSIFQSGGTVASGMSYNWQYFNTATSTWTNTGISSYNFNSPGITTSRDFRLITTCIAGGVSSTSASYSVIVTPALPGGTYTINNALPTAGTNFTSFGDAISAMGCGITASVVFNVNPTTPYVETVYMPYIKNVSATSTIRFNGNGATVQFTNTTSNRQLLVLDSAVYTTFDSLTFKSLDGTYGWGALITNHSFRDSITRCTFDLSSITGTSSVNSNGITFSGSNTSPTTSGANGVHCYVANNVLMGPTGSGGPYYALTMYGPSDSNVIKNNVFKDFYYYGIYLYNAENNLIEGNDINRATKTNVTTFYGMYLNGTGSGNRIIKNRIHSPKAVSATGSGSNYGIYCFGDASLGNKMLIANNAVYDLSLNGLIYGAYISTGAYIDFMHNTINLDQATGSASTSYGMYFTGTNTDLQVKNNLVNFTGGGTGTKYGFYYSTTSAIADAQRNMVYVNPSTGGTSYYGYYAGNYATIAAFQAANPGLEVGSVSVDPNFVSPTTGFLLQTNPAVTTNGTNVLGLVPTDILGAARSATPTPGAFQNIPCIGTPNTPTVTGPDIVCSGAPFVLGQIEGSYTSGLTFDWQFFNTATSTWLSTGTTTSTFNSTGITVDRTYRVVTTCTASGASSTSLGKLVDAVTPVTPVVPDAQTCGPGEVTFTGTVGAGTIYWYASPTSGSPLDTGLVFTTPPLTNTTTYYAKGGASPSIDVQVGEGTATSGTTTAGPFNGSSRKRTMQMMYKASQLLAAGATNASDITSMAFNLVGAAAIDKPGYTISIKTVPAATATLTWQTTGFTTIFGGATTTLPAATPAGWVEFPFTAAYGWDGVSNIIVQVCWSQTTANSSTGTHQYTSTPGQMLYYQNDLAGSACGETGTLSSSFLPNARFSLAGCTSPAIAVVANVRDTPVINISLADGPYCAMKDQTLNIPTGPTQPPLTTFLWSNGNTDRTANVNSSGTYTVTATNEFGCSTSDTVNIILLPSPIVELGADTLVCEGSTVILDAGTTGVSYFWNTGASGNTITVDDGGQYRVIVTNSDGCVASDTINVSVSGFSPLMEGIDVTNLGLFKFQFEPFNPTYVVGYEWDFGDSTALSLDVAPVHTYLAEGTYLVTCRIASTCGTAVYRTNVSIITGIKGVNKGDKDLRLYPNPSTSELTIETIGNIRMEFYTINNVIGQEVQKAELKGATKQNISVSSLPSGVYSISIQTKEGTMIRKFQVIK